MIRRKKSKITASIIALGISIMTFIVCIAGMVYTFCKANGSGIYGIARRYRFGAKRY